MTTMRSIPEAFNTFIGCGGTFSTRTTPRSSRMRRMAWITIAMPARIHKRHVAKIQHADHRKIKIDLVADDTHCVLCAVMIDIAL